MITKLPKEQREENRSIELKGRRRGLQSESSGGSTASFESDSSCTKYVLLRELTQTSKEVIFVLFSSVMD